MSLFIFYHSHDLEISPKDKMGFWSWITYFNEVIKGHIVDDNWCGIKPRYYLASSKFQVYNTV